MKLYIKNMISNHSKKEVERIIEHMGLHIATIEIGMIEIYERLTKENYNELRKTLIQNDFEIITGKENIFIEKIKYAVIEMIHYSDELPEINNSIYISEKLSVNYTYLSKFFSKAKHITLEQFIILHKIERVKQLLLYDEMTLSEIAWKLHYSSTAHLSAQFKKVTGITPTIFKKSKFKKLIPVENL
ncbi:MAG TPA: helix-turn-helix transcriptional regulator [Chitinophagaceae bacterium]